MAYQLHSYKVNSIIILNVQENSLIEFIPSSSLEEGIGLLLNKDLTPYFDDRFHYRITPDGGLWWNWNNSSHYRIWGDRGEYKEIVSLMWEWAFNTQLSGGDEDV